MRPNPRSRVFLHGLAVCVAASLAQAALAFAGEGEVDAGAGVRLAALASGNVLVVFDAQSPGTVTRAAVTGTSGPLLGIDVRPANGKLYALSDANDLYTIEPATGVATLVSTLTVPFDGGERGGFDFNPQADRLRLVSSAGQNLRAHAELGATAVDTSLAFARNDAHQGERPTITAVAYTHSVPNAPSTKTFDIDSSLDLLVLQDPPNDGTLTTVGPLGVDFGPTGGFDVVTDSAGRDRAFAASGSKLYAVDLASGRATPLGTVGDGAFEIIGLAVLGPESGAAPSDRGRAP